MNTLADQLIPLQEAAKELGVHRVSIHRYIRQGRLQAFKRKGFDHKTYLKRAEVEAMKDFVSHGL